MTNKLVKTIPLPETPTNVPTLSLHVLAKNAENVIGRLIDCVKPYVQAYHFILNDTTDATEKVIRSRLTAGETLQLRHVTFATHPNLYFLDEPFSYEVGLPLDGESFAGPYTHAPLLCDWAGIRNLGWSSACDFRLFLDADDVVNNPSELPGLLCVLRDLGADLAATRYVFGRSPGGMANSMSYRERLARNTPNIRWVGSTHEILAGGLRTVLAEDRLLVTDMKDNWGKGVRVPGRCFKVLYREARLQSWKVTPRHLAYLVQEAPGMMDLAWVWQSLLPRYLAVAPQAEERAWVLCMVGEMCEAAERISEAADYYELASAEYTSSKAAWRLCRARFKLGDWRRCIEAYNLGLCLKHHNQVLDAGPVYEDSSKIFAGQAYCELGELDKAVELLEQAAKAFPTSEPVRELLRLVREKRLKG